MIIQSVALSFNIVEVLLLSIDSFNFESHQPFIVLELPFASYEDNQRLLSHITIDDEGKRQYFLSFEFWWKIDFPLSHSTLSLIFSKASETFFCLWFCVLRICSNLRCLQFWFSLGWESDRKILLMGGRWWRVYFGLISFLMEIIENII